MKPKIRVLPITQLVLDDKNANKGTKRGRELLGESLERYGAGRSVVVDCHQSRDRGQQNRRSRRRFRHEIHSRDRNGWLVAGCCPAW